MATAVVLPLAHVPPAVDGVDRLPETVRECAAARPAAAAPARRQNSSSTSNAPCRRRFSWRATVTAIAAASPTSLLGRVCPPAPRPRASARTTQALGAAGGSGRSAGGRGRRRGRVSTCSAPRLQAASKRRASGPPSVEASPSRRATTTTSPPGGGPPERRAPRGDSASRGSDAPMTPIALRYARYLLPLLPALAVYLNFVKITYVTTYHSA